MSQSSTLVCPDCGQTNRLPAERLGLGPKCGTCGAGLVTGKVFDLDPAGFDKALRHDSLPLLVDFWAPWCGPCRAMAPQFAEAARGAAGRVRFARLNTEDHPRVSQRLGIRGIPLLILFDKGREQGRLSGARPAAEITRFLAQSLKAGA